MAGEMAVGSVIPAFGTPPGVREYGRGRINSAGISLLYTAAWLIGQPGPVGVSQVGMSRIRRPAGSAQHSGGGGFAGSLSCRPHCHLHLHSCPHRARRAWLATPDQPMSRRLRQQLHDQQLALPALALLVDRERGTLVGWIVLSESTVNSGCNDPVLGSGSWPRWTWIGILFACACHSRHLHAALCRAACLLPPPAPAAAPLPAAQRLRRHNNICAHIYLLPA